MIDYILKFETQTQAETALVDWTVTDEESGMVRWKPKPKCGILPIEVILQEAVWDISDPQNPAETTPEIKSDGYWVAVNIPKSAALFADLIKNSPYFQVSHVSKPKNTYTLANIQDLLDLSKVRFKAQIKAFSDKIANSLTAKYSQAEINSFGSKLAAAEAEILGAATQIQTELLEAEASILGIPISTLAPIIKAKGSVLNQVVGNIAGFRVKTEAAIDAAATEYEMLAIMTASAAQAMEKLQSILGGT